MFPRTASILGWLGSLLASRSDLVIENLALRQQLAILTAKRHRPRIPTADRVFWVALRRLWPRWKDVLVVVRPDTVVRWHREGFRRYRTWKSRRRRTGRLSTAGEIRALIRRMVPQTTGRPLRTTFYPAGTTLAGAGLSPAGSTDLLTAHPAEFTPFAPLDCREGSWPRSRLISVVEVSYYSNFLITTT